MRIRFESGILKHVGCIRVEAFVAREAEFVGCPGVPRSVKKVEVGRGPRAAARPRRGKLLSRNGIWQRL